MGVENSVVGDDYEGNMANNGEANDDGVVRGEVNDGASTGVNVEKDWVIVDYD